MYYIMLKATSAKDSKSSYFPQILFVNGPEQGCGGNVNVTNTAQFRTQLSDNYEPLQDCHWLIYAPQSYTIQLTIDEIDIKNTTFNDTSVNERMACNSDYLEVCYNKYPIFDLY